MVENEYHHLDKRLSVVEIKIKHIDSELVGQREALDGLVRATQNNGQEITKLDRNLSRKADATMMALSTHAAAEAEERANTARKMIWTLLSTLATFGAVMLGYILNHT